MKPAITILNIRLHLTNAVEKDWHAVSSKWLLRAVIAALVVGVMGDLVLVYLQAKS